MSIVTGDADTVSLLERALAQTAAIIAAIPSGQAGSAGPVDVTVTTPAGTSNAERFTYVTPPPSIF